MTTYCPECDEKTETAEVDGYNTTICRNCSKVTVGYPIEHRELIMAIRGKLRNREWQTRSMYLAILDAGWGPA